MSRKYIILIMIFILPALKDIFPQNLSELENRFSYFSRQIEREETSLDSLKLILQQRAGKIDEQKKRNPADKDKIIGLMSSSASLSNNIEKRTDKIEKLRGSLEMVKKSLYRRYTAILDSLNRLQQQTDDKSEIAELNKKILTFTEKRLLASPGIDFLSFNPNRILQINPNEMKDESGKKIYTEYIKNAAAEVDDRLRRVNESYNEVQKITYLRKKAGRFMDEADFDRDAGFLRRRNTSSANRSYRSPSEVLLGGSASGYDNQAQSYVNILNQFTSGMPSAYQTSAGIKQRNLSLEEYQKLLKELKKKLTEYKAILNNKLGRE